MTYGDKPNFNGLRDFIGHELLTKTMKEAKLLGENLDVQYRAKARVLTLDKELAAQGAA